LNLDSAYFNRALRLDDDVKEREKTDVKLNFNPSALSNYKKLIKKVLNWAGVVFFMVAVAAVYSQLARHSLAEIKEAIFSIPIRNLVYALITCAGAYAVLALYDRLALRYVGRTLDTWKWMLAGFLGFAISNNAGSALVSGAAIRYRLYTRWKFRMHEIFRMIIFSGFTYLVGYLFMIVSGYFFIPQDMRGSSAVAVAFWPCVIVFAVYFVLAAVYKRGIPMGDYTLKMPTVGTAAMQTALGACDVLFTSLVLYSVLYPLVQVPFKMYVGVFVVSHALGMLTPVPGALGLFEALFLFFFPAEGHEAAVFGALIAYRVVYFLIPLVIAGLIMLLIPPYLKYRRKKFIREQNIRQNS